MLYNIVNQAHETKRSGVLHLYNTYNDPTAAIAVVMVQKLTSMGATSTETCDGAATHLACSGWYLEDSSCTVRG